MIQEAGGASTSPSDDDSATEEGRRGPRPLGWTMRVKDGDCGGSKVGVRLGAGGAEVKREGGGEEATTAAEG